MAARKSPVGQVTGRVGNYAAPVDTSTMDPDMQDTMKGKRPITPLSKLMGMFKGKQTTIKPSATASTPVKPPPPTMSQADQDKIFKLAKQQTP